MTHDSQESSTNPLSELIGYLELFLPALWACATAENGESLRTARVEWHHIRRPFTKRFPGLSTDAEDVLFANVARFMSCDLAEIEHQHIIDEGVAAVIDLARTPLSAISPVFPVATDTDDQRTLAKRAEDEERAWEKLDQHTARLRRARLLLTKLRKLSALWLASEGKHASKKAKLRPGPRAKNDDLFEFEAKAREANPSISDKEILAAFKEIAPRHSIFQNDDPQACLRSARARRNKPKT